MTYIYNNDNKRKLKEKSNVISSFLMIILFSLILQLFLPWYLIALIAFVVCFFNIAKPAMGFLVSLLAVFILWVGKALYADMFFDIPMSSLLGSVFGDISASAIFFLTGLIGGIVAGFGGLSGSLLHKILSKNERN